MTEDEQKKVDGEEALKKKLPFTPKAAKKEAAPEVPAAATPEA